MELKDPIEYHLQRVNALDRRQFLRPMSSTEILERAARVYQLSAQAILPKTLLPNTFTFVSLVFMANFLFPSLVSIQGGENLQRDFVTVGMSIILTMFVALPLFMLGLGQSFSIALEEVKDYITGDRIPGEAPPPKSPPINPIEFTKLLTITSLGAFLPLLSGTGMFLFGAIVENGNPGSPLPVLFAILGTLFLVGATILTPVLLMRNSLIPVVALIEFKTGKAARLRGQYLIKSFPTTGGIWESMLLGLVMTFFIAIGLYFMVNLITTFALGQQAIQNWIGSNIFGQLIESAVSMIPIFVVLWLLTPLWAILCTTVYYDRRVRIEGFDIRVLAKDVLEIRE